MKLKYWLVITGLAGTLGMPAPRAAADDGGLAAMSFLPAADKTGGQPLNKTIAARRSVRDFSTVTLSDRQVGQLLWAAQGITEPNAGLRAAPSAGAIYPLLVYAVTAAGVAQYIPERHALQMLKSGDIRAELASAALGQAFVLQAPLTIVISALPERMTKKYGRKDDRFIAMEAGHVVENVLLTAVSLGLGAVPVGAFDTRANKVMGCGPNEEVFYMVSVGYAAVAAPADH